MRWISCFCHGARISGCPAYGPSGIRRNFSMKVMTPRPVGRWSKDLLAIPDARRLAIGRSLPWPYARHLCHLPARPARDHPAAWRGPQHAKQMRQRLGGSGMLRRQGGDRIQIRIRPPAPFAQLRPQALADTGPRGRADQDRLSGGIEPGRRQGTDNRSPDAGLGGVELGRRHRALARQGRRYHRERHARLATPRHQDAPLRYSLPVYPLWETLGIGETCRLASQNPSRPESAGGVCKSTCPPRPLENSQLRRGSPPEGSPGLRSPSISITRVPRVERPTINADIQGVPALLGAVVAINAKALQSASQKLVPVSAMRSDV